MKCFLFYLEIDSQNYSESKTCCLVFNVKNDVFLI